MNPPLRPTLSHGPDPFSPDGEDSAIIYHDPEVTAYRSSEAWSAFNLPNASGIFPLTQDDDVSAKSRPASPRPSPKPANVSTPAMPRLPEDAAQHCLQHAVSKAAATQVEQMLSTSQNHADTPVDPNMQTIIGCADDMLDDDMATEAATVMDTEQATDPIMEAVFEQVKHELHEAALHELAPQLASSSEHCVAMAADGSDKLRRHPSSNSQAATVLHRLKKLFKQHLSSEGRPNH